MFPCEATTPCRSFNQRHKPSGGFTLLETLIYIGLVALVMAALAFILLAVFQARSIAAAQIRLQNTERIVEWTLRERLEESMEVAVPTSGTSSYLLIEAPDTDESPVLFVVVSETLMMQLGDASAEALTPANIRVTSFSVERLDGAPASVTIEVVYETDALNAAIQASSTVSVTLRYEEDDD